MPTFHLIIASVGENRFDGPVVSATIPTTNGLITVLADHEAMIASLGRGTVVARPASGESKQFDIEGGVLECSSNKVTLLL